ncbi:MAG: glycosyl hydrolase-related protein [Chloroflexi bacterium]|nr:glycosyl hydrolase-related protein [Chloroflexota bacterium]
MELKAIERVIGQKIDAFRMIQSAVQWRYLQGNAPGAETLGYNDSSWQLIQVPTTWAGAAGDAWLRRTFQFPDIVEGVSTSGARVELPVMIPIHSQIFVDGVERVAEPSWLDTRAVPLVLVDAYQPGQVIQVTAHACQGDGFGLFIGDRVEISSLENVVFRLLTVRAQFMFTHFIAYESAAAFPAWQAAWQAAAECLDHTALAENRWEEWWTSVANARLHLQPMADEAKTYTTHLIAHSHIDMNWLWTWEETVDVIKRDFTAVENLMRRYPDFYFSQSQAGTYRAMEERYPEVWKQVKQRVAEGRWDVTANTWVEGDLNMAGGEALVHHLLYTRPYIRKTLGVSPRICWEPDTFGHVATLPQLLRQVGIDYYYHCRAGQGQSVYWWEGLDGSRVLAFNDPLGYGGTIDANSLVLPALDTASRYKLKHSMFVYGVGDHGGGGTARDIEHARSLLQEPFLPKATMSDTISFYDEARTASTDLPVIHGELNTTFEGCYTSHGDIKKLNRRAESNLLSAEALASAAAIQAGKPYPLEEFGEAWRIALFHQFHDILCGCAIGATYKEAAAAMQPALETAASIQKTSLAALNARVDTGTGNEDRVVIWNPLGWERDDVARILIGSLTTIPSAMKDDTGRIIPVQQVGDYLVFVAANVPALGCRVYTPTNEPAATDLSIDAYDAVQNAYLRFHVNSASGAIDTLHDLEAKRVVDTGSNWRGVERKEDAGYINRLQVLWEQPHSMSAWNIGDITRIDNLIEDAQVKVVEQGPVCIVVEANQSFLNSHIVQRYCLYTGLRRIDIETKLDWHEHGGKETDAPMLRATFKPKLSASTATFEVAFAGLERPATGDEVPALRWADVSDKEYGLSLLNDCKYGHQAHGNTLGLTLVRAPYEPDNLPDQGIHSFTYALYPHPNGWQQAHTERIAAAFNQPLLCAVEPPHSGTIIPGKGLLSCSAPNVMITTVKYAETGDKALIVRIVEMHGQPANAQLRWGWHVSKVEQVNPVEEHYIDISAQPDGCDVPLLKHEIVTLKLWLV